MKKFEIKTTTVSVKGSSHAKNEDVTFSEEIDSLYFFGLADGQSKKAFCAEGGKACLEAAAAYIAEKGIKNFKDRVYYDEISYEIIGVIRRTIEKMSFEMKAERNEFSSTLVMIAIDLESGDYISIHLGDGVIIGCSSDGPCIISYPENGITSKYTWLTTSDNAMMHLRVRFGNIENFFRVFFLSDGLESLCKGKNITLAGRRVLCAEDITDLMDFVNKGTYYDDATCGILSVSRKSM